MSTQTRSERKNSSHANRAVDAQMRGGIDGAIRWTLYGATACVIAHFTWPFFRRQTLALKGFITSSATIFGLVIGADTHLLNYEDHLRRSESEIRRKARISLTREGKMPTEAEILKWREEQAEGSQGQKKG